MNQPSAKGSSDATDWPCGLVSCSSDGVIREVNETFLGWTGYSRTDVVGRRRLRDLLTVGGRMLYETHLGPLISMYGQVTEIALDVQRADGKPLPVLVNAARRVRDGAELDIRFSIVVVNERRSYEKELLEARRVAESAGAASERVQRQLSLMADVNLILSGTLDLDVALQGLARMLAAERFGYCVIVTHRDDRDHPSTSAAAVHPDIAESAAALVAVVAGAAQPAGASVDSATTKLTRALMSTTPQLIANVTAEFGSTIIVPVRARGHHVATVVLSRPVTTPAFQADDLIEFAGLADRIGLFVDNLRLYRREHARAIALQQALLTPPPEPAGLEIVTRYLPSADDAMVGGDWYDAFIRPDGATVVVIGDVTGHDHVAAAAMGQLRGLLRSLAYTGGKSPADVLREVDAAAKGLGVSTYATAVVALLHPSQPGTAQREVVWASAGHLPPALLTAAGDVMLLDAKPDLMLGVDPDRPRRNRQLSFPPESTLLLYTDGLVEDALRSLDDGLDDLVSVLSGLAAEPLDVLCTEVLRRMSAAHRTDDIALLAIRSAAADAARA